ncbi:ligand-binding sensor domain-containing diguanylate cyclase [Pseudoduganella sp. OTU4001]|uniref:ligand-binding sensor domain-containing diguanylate cyclase n=1 Tax=Pseudoduganella sp. OTU4001 TaxID=3043854 RepID=UPI00313C9A0F
MAWAFLAASAPAAPAAAPLLGATPDRALSQYRLDGWQVEQGLPQNAVSALVHASDGYLWVGTLAGLVRFDGNRFTSFEVAESADIAAQPVLGLMEDAQHNLWIGHNKGAAIYRDGKFRQMFSAGLLGDQRVWSFAQAPDGAVWAATSNGLVRWDKGVARYFRQADGLPTDRLRAVAFDRDGVLWIASSGGGLISYSGGRFRVYNPDNGFPHLQVRSVLADPAGGVWAATAGGGLARVLGERIKVYTVADGLPTDQLTALTRDPQGTLWVGTWGSGVVRMVGERFSAIASNGGLAGDHIWSLLADREGSMWVGTWVSGLARLRSRPFSVVGMPEGLSHDNVRAILPARNGVTWVATAGGGLNRIDANGIRVLGKQAGLPSEEISSLLEEADGTLWIGTYTNGVARLREGKVTVFDTPQGLPSSDVRVLYQDRQGVLWAGTQSGVARLAGKQFEALRAAGAPSGVVSSILQDRAGTLWLGTAGEGLVRYRDGVFKTMTAADGLLSNWIMSLYEDASGTLWIGSNGDGLNRLRGEHLGRIRPADGLWDGTCLSILEDRDGYLWMTTNRGFYRVARSELDAFAEGKLARVRSAGFGPADLMRSTTFAGGLQPTSALDSAGNLLLPSAKGVVTVDPRRLPDSARPPQVVLQSITVNGAVQAAAAELQLPPGPLTVSIQYNATNLMNAERVRFRYQLEGLARDWIDVGPNRVVTFPALAHGNYRFRVVASIDGQRWSDAGSAMSLRVPPYFYQTRWFAVLLALATMGAAYGLYRLRVRHLRRRQAEMERLVAEKTEALKQANEHLSRLSFVDALTGLANRRRFDDALRDEWQRAARNGAPLALVICDIDYFKDYNDALGHQEGDRCLAAVASVFQHHVRRGGDLAARYGGEEFVFLCANTELHGALAIAEELRAACAGLAIPHPASAVAPVITLSLGVAVCQPARGEPLEALVQQADAALYCAKREGRNRVCGPAGAPSAEVLASPLGLV